MIRECLAGHSADRVVIKVGTSSLITDGRLDSAKVHRVCAAISSAILTGVSPVLVASGAIAIGRARHRALVGSVPGLQQAAAAIGQGTLYLALQECFAYYGVRTGQILLTPFDLICPERDGGVRHTFDVMHALGFVPIVNENDALQVRNNDVLAAILSSYLGARLLLLLTSVPGLHDSDPLVNVGAARIAEVTNVTAELEATAGDALGDGGTGGMAMKLAACRIATYAGVRAVITNTIDAAALTTVGLDGVVGTVFHQRPAFNQTPDLGRLWRAFRAPPCGSVRCSPAGRLAVENRASLRRRDVTAISGAFGAGDVVDITGPDEQLIARGGIRLDSVSAESGCAPDAALLISSDYVRIMEDQLCR
jgi:glutamate 5-kinase